MNWTDIGISLGLIILVLRQIRGRQLSVASLLWPVGLVLWAAFEYLGTIPGERSDILFATVLAVIGLALGLGCAVLTRVYREDDKVMVKARPAAAALWIAGMCSRLVFGIVALHGGAEAIGRLSGKLDLHSIVTWSTALITMALCEVLSRTLVLGLRYRRASGQRPERSQLLSIKITNHGRRYVNGVTAPQPLRVTADDTFLNDRPGEPGVQPNRRISQREPRGRSGSGPWVGSLGSR